MSAGLDLYAVLGVKPSAGLEQIRGAYRRGAKRCHPDMGGTQEMMLRLTTAWKILSDTRARTAYDKSRTTSNDPPVKNDWATASDDAKTWAQKSVKVHGNSWEEFVAWVNQATDDVQQKPRGRTAAGATAGILIGATAGLIAGHAVGMASLPAIAIGCAAGAIGGTFAAKDKRSNPDRP
jgi:curved DNA-binding protein CbpA